MRARQMLMVLILLMIAPAQGSWFGTEEPPESKMDTYQKFWKEKRWARSVAKVGGARSLISQIPGVAGLFKVQKTIGELNKSNLVLEIYTNLESLNTYFQKSLISLQKMVYEGEYSQMFDLLYEAFHGRSYADHYSRFAGGEVKKLFWSDYPDFSEALLVEAFKNTDNSSLKANIARLATQADLPRVCKAMTSAESAHFEEHDACGICLDELSKKKSITTAPCKHTFHADCLHVWTREHNTCPYCRSRLLKPLDKRKYWFDAIRNKSPKCVKAIMKNMNNFGNALHFIATETGDLGNMCETVLENGMEPFIGNEADGKTPLMVAAENNKPEVVKCLIRHGARVDSVATIPKRNGGTALGFALSGDHKEVCRILLENPGENHADPNKPNGEISPLHWHLFVSKNHDGEICTMLLQKGAKLRDYYPFLKLDGQPITPFLHAIIKGNQGCIGAIASRSEFRMTTADFAENCDLESDCWKNIEKKLEDKTVKKIRGFLNVY